MYPMSFLDKPSSSQGLEQLCFQVLATFPSFNTNQMGPSSSLAPFVHCVFLFMNDNLPHFQTKEASFLLDFYKKHYLKVDNLPSFFLLFFLIVFNSRFLAPQCLLVTCRLLPSPPSLWLFTVCLPFHCLHVSFACLCTPLAPYLFTCVLHVHRTFTCVLPIHLRVTSLGTHQPIVLCLLVTSFLAHRLLLCGTTSFPLPTCASFGAKNKQANFH